MKVHEWISSCLHKGHHIKDINLKQLFKSLTENCSPDTKACFHSILQKNIFTKPEVNDWWIKEVLANREKKLETVITDFMEKFSPELCIKNLELRLPHELELQDNNHEEFYPEYLVPLIPTLNQGKQILRPELQTTAKLLKEQQGVNILIEGSSAEEATGFIEQNAQFAKLFAIDIQRFKASTKYRGELLGKGILIQDLLGVSTGNLVVFNNNWERLLLTPEGAEVMEAFGKAQEVGLIVAASPNNSAMIKSLVKFHEIINLDIVDPFHLFEQLQEMVISKNLSIRSHILHHIIRFGVENRQAPFSWIIHSVRDTIINAQQQNKKVLTYNDVLDVMAEKRGVTPEDFFMC